MDRGQPSFLAVMLVGEGVVRQRFGDPLTHQFRRRAQRHRFQLGRRLGLVLLAAFGDPQDVTIAILADAHHQHTATLRTLPPQVRLRPMPSRYACGQVPSILRFRQVSIRSHIF